MDGGANGDGYMIVGRGRTRTRRDLRRRKSLRPHKAVHLRECVRRRQTGTQPSRRDGAAPKTAKSPPWHTDFSRFQSRQFQAESPASPSAAPPRQMALAISAASKIEICKKPCRCKTLKPVLNLNCRAAFSPSGLSPYSCLRLVAVLRRADHAQPVGRERGDTEPYRVGHAISTPKDRGSFDYG